MEDRDRRLLEMISAWASDKASSLRLAGDVSPSSGEAERAAILRFVHENNPGPLSEETLLTVFNELLFASVSLARPLRVAFLGPYGTFSSVALHEFFGESASRVPVKSIPDVFVAVESGDADCGIVPVENSTEGAVTYTLDELVDTNLQVTGERYIRISYCVLSREKEPSSVKKIYSHPQPLAQCRGWLRANMPDATIVPVESTARAAEIASGEDGSAAVSAEISARLFGLNILHRRIEDLRQNYTRFFSIGGTPVSPTGNDKTSLVCSVKDQPSALYRLLAPFAGEGINMTRIESRPDRKRVWTYNFFIDFAGHVSDTPVVRALERMRDETVFLKILGSYPAGEKAV